MWTAQHVFAASSIHCPFHIAGNIRSPRLNVSIHACQTYGTGSEIQGKGQPLELRKMKWKRIHSEAEEERWEKELFQGLIDEARERMTLDREVQQQRSNKRRASRTDARAHTRAHIHTCAHARLDTLTWPLKVVVLRPLWRQSHDLYFLCRNVKTRYLFKK